MVTRTQILQEIKRIAQEDGGDVPGERTFKSKTRIEEFTRTVWKEYWRRWSQAQRDAGFEPKTRTIGYDETILLEKMAKLTRKVRRIPDNYDVSKERRADKSLPTHQTLAKRLGVKAVRVRKLRTFCESHNEYRDVLPYCDQYRPSTQREVPDVATPRIEKKAGTGFVYLAKVQVRGVGRPLFYIGKSNSVLKRIGQHRGNPEFKVVTTMHSISSPKSSLVETFWHRRFADKQADVLKTTSLRGSLYESFFDLDEEDIALFKQVSSL